MVKDDDPVGCKNHGKVKQQTLPSQWIIFDKLLPRLLCAHVIV